MNKSTTIIHKTGKAQEENHADQIIYRQNRE